MANKGGWSRRFEGPRSALLGTGKAFGSGFSLRIVALCAQVSIGVQI